MNSSAGRALAPFGFEVIGTGGNCTAFCLDMGEIEVLIADDAQAPEALSVPVYVGATHKPTGEDIFVVRFDSLEEFVTWFEGDPAAMLAGLGDLRPGDEA